MFKKFLFLVSCKGIWFCVLGFNKVFGLVFNSGWVVFVWLRVYV